MHGSRVLYSKIILCTAVGFSLKKTAVHCVLESYMNGSLFFFLKLPHTVFWHAICTAVCCSLKKLPGTVFWHAICTTVCFSIKILPCDIFWNANFSKRLFNSTGFFMDWKSQTEFSQKILPCTKFRILI